MATATTPQAKPNWVQKAVRLWGLTKLAHEGMMVDKLQQQTAAVMDLAKRTREGTLGKPGGTSSSEDDMGVSIGNEIHYHPQPSGMGGLARAAVATALLASGVSIGGMAVMLLRPPTKDTDTDTSIGVSIPVEDQVKPTKPSE